MKTDVVRMFLEMREEFSVRFLRNMLRFLENETQHQITKTTQNAKHCHQREIGVRWMGKEREKE